MDIKIPLMLCKRHFGNAVSAELRQGLTEVTEMTRGAADTFVGQPRMKYRPGRRRPGLHDLNTVIAYARFDRYRRWSRPQR